jgi:hypothetical protein
MVLSLGVSDQNCLDPDWHFVFDFGAVLQLKLFQLIAVSDGQQLLYFHYYFYLVALLSFDLLLEPRALFEVDLYRHHPLGQPPPHLEVGEHGLLPLVSVVGDHQMLVLRLGVDLLHGQEPPVLLLELDRLQMLQLVVD